MKIVPYFLLFLLFSIKAQAQKADSLMLRKIFDEALVNGHSYQNLEHLCKQIGPRLSGSPGAAKAVNWSKSLMEKYGFDRVYLQEVWVPHWVRGEKESARIIIGKESINVPIAALGGSIATPKAGIKAPVIEVQSIEELEELGELHVKGKVVFFNGAFDPRPISTGESYGHVGGQRYSGPTKAAHYGAVGAIVRSLTHSIDDFPHTGATAFDPNGKNIPAAAISTKAADLLSKMLKDKANLLFYFKQSCKTLPDVLSYNVIGEIRGSEKPEEILIAGAHLDSWDLAEGAHDDGAGVVQMIEALRIFKTLGYKPRRTTRVVLFMNEENGLRGGIKYAEIAKQRNENHLAAIESDAGGFTPRGFTFDADPSIVKTASSKWNELLSPYFINSIIKGWGGADIGPLKSAVPGIVLIGFMPDSQRYFDYHHAANDVFENVNKRELELGSASIASLLYLIDRSGFE